MVAIIRYIASLSVNLFVFYHVLELTHIHWQDLAMSLQQKKRDSNILTHKAELERNGSQVISNLLRMARELEEWSIWLCMKADNGDSDGVTLEDAQASRAVYMQLRADFDAAVSIINRIEEFEGNPELVAQALAETGQTLEQLDAKFD